MTKAKDRAVYRLELRSGPSAIPETIRLRRILKSLLREFSFRAVRVEKVETKTKSLTRCPAVRVKKDSASKLRADSAKQRVKAQTGEKQR